MLKKSTPRGKALNNETPCGETEGSEGADELRSHLGRGPLVECLWVVPLS